MRIVVTGTEGQFVRSLVERASLQPDLEIVPLGRPRLDLARPAEARRTIRTAAPDIVVSAAAYTAVDAAEDEPELARAINEDGARAVAEAAEACGVPVIHLSTDYVFAGRHDGHYREDMPAEPAGTYGRTKLAGERAVRQANSRSIILRTAWVYSPFGKNFVTTMLKLAAQRDTVSVVDDQIGNPTSALDLADAVMEIARQFESGDGRAGTYHYAGLGDVTWCGFARHIFAESAARGGPHAEVRAIATAEYPTRATRPGNSRLDTSKITDRFAIQPRDWRASVAAVVDRLVAYSLRTGTGRQKE